MLKVLAGLVFVTSQLAVATDFCMSENPPVVAKVDIKESEFPKANVTLIAATSVQAKTWNLTGFYIQGYDFGTNKKFSGWHVPFDGNPLSNGPYFRITYEDGAAEGKGILDNSEFLGQSELVKLVCTPLREK